MSSLAWSARLLLALLVFWILGLAKEHSLAIAILAVPLLLALLLPGPRLGSTYVRVLGPPPLPEVTTMTEAALVGLRAAEQGTYNRSMIAAAILLGSALWLGASSGWSARVTVVPPVALGLMLVARVPMLFSISRFTNLMAARLGRSVRPLEAFSLPVALATVLLLLILWIAILTLV
jgi:hypothetical protein